MKMSKLSRSAVPTAKSSRKRNAPRVNPSEYTPHYAYNSAGRGAARTQELYCEGVSLEKIAEAVGTPAYIYSKRSIEDAYRALDRSFGALPHMLCYAMKANSNLSVLRVLANLGSGFDIVSGGELDRLRRIGVPGNRIVFSGVGKTREEIRDALRYKTKESSRSGILPRRNFSEKRSHCYSARPNSSVFSTSASISARLVR